MRRRLWRWLYRLVIRLWQWLMSGRPWSRRRFSVALTAVSASPPRRIFAPPKPTWVRHEVIRLKALMPQAGCRTIAHYFNRRWSQQRQMTVSKTYVADTCRKQQHLILAAQRRFKHRVPRRMPHNWVWGCDLLTKTDQQGQPHVALAILDHASRACLRLQRLSDKSSWTLWHELVQVVKRYGRPQFLRTDNEAVLVSRVFRLGLWLLGIHQQRIEPGCPWQNGRVERFIGTVKRELARDPVADSHELTRMLRKIRSWYNHERPHDHLHGRTPAEVWAGINVFEARSG